MVKCAVSTCSHYWKIGTSVKLYRFPKNPVMREKWMVACGIEEKLKEKDLRICSEHFTNEDWRLKDILLKIPVEKRLLKESAVPTINLPVHSDTESADESTEEDQPMDYSTQVNWRSEVIQIPEQLPTVTVDTASQTEADPECMKELQIMHLLREIRLLKRRDKKRVKRLQEAESAQQCLQKLFTKRQIRRMENPSKYLPWKSEDISSAISLHSAGPRAYRLLRKRNFPLPSPSTLRRWAAKLKLKPGRSDISQQVSSSSNVEESEERFENEQISNKMLSNISDVTFEASDAENDEEVVEYSKSKVKDASTGEDTTHTCVDELSEGGHVKPNKEFLEELYSFENIFLTINKDNLLVNEV